MTFLLDTHALIWWLVDDARLSEPARSAISDSENDVYVSAVSAWEISTKARFGKLLGLDDLLADFSTYITRAGFLPLEITVQHAVAAGAWPQAHRDPFDRMLAAQAHEEDLRLVTRDRAFEAFPLILAW